ncbi:tellurite resistance/C4-dicarboxylate transporter family protein [Stenotrophomonas sp. YIM B06876]|uniref:tellurite resistance/C4-dicarboxylate transporter family protein n=1 Tax=Stenotrophomonas sp. YIM B06876 TaxID=3060211 RepID=UPI0027387D41|nr:tellurite resistance/C4-dicarboxylate transporter family protein [Stenotrophomonas sp. YIM B06876]
MSTSRPTAARALETLSPAYFGMVMATGILSIASHMLGVGWLAHGLFVLNLALYPLLGALYLLRLKRYPRAVAADLGDHLRGPGYFTVVAATGVLGSQCLLLAGSLAPGLLLWGLAALLWLFFTYAIFTLLTIKEAKPALDRGINGGWLLAVVATQSVAVLSALLAARIGQPWKLEMNLLALSMWLWGGMLYIWMMSLIFYRYTFFRFRPDDLAPPYWINMGAMAISTLGGSLLIGNAAEAPFLHSLLPFLKGFTVFYWATGTWWIPMLLVLALWRYACKRFPLKYDPLYWGAVFPLGMYAASTHELVVAMDFPFLTTLPGVFLGTALLAWIAAFAGALRHAWHALAAGIRAGRPHN